MTSQIEIEYKFININVVSIIKKLKENKAKFVFDTVYKIYNHDKPSWKSYQGKIRLRQGDNKTTMAYKAELENGFDEEIEFQIQDLDKAHTLMTKIGIPLKRKEQKRRIRYTLNNCEVDIDLWPDIEPYLEIESNSQDNIRQVVELLGLDMQNGIKSNAATVYKQLTGKDVPHNWIFKKNDWRLSCYKDII